MDPEGRETSVAFTVMKIGIRICGGSLSWAYFLINWDLVLHCIAQNGDLQGRVIHPFLMDQNPLSMDRNAHSMNLTEGIKAEQAVYIILQCPAIIEIGVHDILIAVWVTISIAIIPYNILHCCMLCSDKFSWLAWHHHYEQCCLTSILELWTVFQKALWLHSAPFLTSTLYLYTRVKVP